MRIKKLLCFLMIIIVIYSAFTLSIHAKIAVPEYSAQTVDALIMDWKRALNGEKIENLSVDSTETYLIIPKIKNLDVNHLKVSVSDWKICFSYFTSPDDWSTWITIWVNREKDSFSSGVNGLEILDGKAVHNGIWHIDYATHDVSIQAKIEGEHNAIKDASELDYYFDFEIVDLTEKSPSWKMPLIIGSCAAVVAVAALGTLVVVKKKKSK